MTDDIENIEEIVASTEASTNSEIPMGDQTPEAHQGNIPPTQPEGSFFEFEYNGKAVKVPQNDPRVKQWIQMGYGAPQEIGKWKSEANQWKSKATDYETRFKGFDQYASVDKWAKENPQAWQSLVSQWQQALNNGQTTQSQVPPQVMQKIQELEGKFQSIEQKEQQQREFVADQSLDTEIRSIRESYPNLDFGDPRDRNSLEQQILKHGIENGIPSFKAAFRDYCFEHLTKIAEEKGKESVGRSLQKTQRLGLQGKTPAPQGTRGQAPNLKNLNYDQIEQLALAELGLG